MAITPVTEFTIKRSVWLRSEPDSFLLRKDDQKQCCVGIYLEACGVARDEIAGVESAVGVNRDDIPGWLVGESAGSSDLAGELYDENDDYGDEKQIAYLFARAGITVRFED